MPVIGYHLTQEKKDEIEGLAEKAGLTLSEYVRQKVEHRPEKKSDETDPITSDGEFTISDGKLWRKRESQFTKKPHWEEVKDVDEDLSISDLRREKLEEEIKLLRAKRFNIGARLKKETGYREPLSVDQCPKCRVSFRDDTGYQRGMHFGVCRGTHAYNEDGKNLFIGSGRNELDDLDK